MNQLTQIPRLFNKLVAFIKEAWLELQRTHKPSRRELTAFTIVVLITMGAVAVYVGVLDLLFRWLGGVIYPQGT